MELDRFRQILLKECGLDFNKLLVVGVSGGPDSLCLLDMLNKIGVPLLVAHFDHNLRPESATEARLVQDEASRLGLRFVLGAGDVREAAGAEGLSIEEAARRARYQFLFSQARASGAAAVAVAHHADDQVETILMHLLRGSGLSGLKGMTHRAVLPVWDSEIPLVRPLLEMWRTDILAYCEEYQLNPVFDHTNSDTRYFRNRLRHELIPTLQSYNPNFKEGMLRMSCTLAGDYELLREVTREHWEECLVRKEAGYLVLDAALLRGYSSGLRKNIIREGIAHLRPALRDIDFEMVARAEGFILEPSNTRQMKLTSQLWLAVEGDALIIAEDLTQVLDPNWPLMEQSGEVPMRVPSRMSLAQGWCLVVELCVVTNLDRARLTDSDPNEAWLDAEKLGNRLTLRTRRPGDRFQPLGMGGHSVKLSDFWINERLPKRARERCPLVCCGDEIAWVCGSRIAEPFRVTGSTLQAVHLRLERIL